MSGSKLERDKQALLAFVAIGLVAGLLTALIFSGLGRPLFWNDEADTAVLGERVLRHGRPVVTGEPSLAYYVRPEHIRSDGAYTAGVYGASTTSPLRESGPP